MQNLLLGEPGTIVVRLWVLYDHIQEDQGSPITKSDGVLPWHVAMEPGDTSWEVIQLFLPCLEVLNEWNSVKAVMNEWGQAEFWGQPGCPSFLRQEMFIAIPEVAVTCNLENLPLSFTITNLVTDTRVVTY